MKKTLFLNLYVFVFTAVYLSVNAQNRSNKSTAYTFENAVTFLSQHTGIPSEAFDVNTFKYYENTLMNGVKMSGMYIAARSEQLGGFYEFFIRTDRSELAGQYWVFPVTGCFGKKVVGIQSFTVKNDECMCKTASEYNYQMKARDINAVFK